MSNSTAQFNTGAPSQSVISATVGPLVLGCGFQSILFGMILILMARYYERRAAHDCNFYVFLVLLLFILNIREGAMDMRVLYRTAVSHHGNYHYFDLQTWTMWYEPGTTALVGLIAQLFFMERCVIVTKRSPYVIAGLSLLLLLSFGSGLAVSISFSKVQFFSLLSTIPIPMTFWLISTAVADLAIALILSVAFWKMKSNTRYARTEPCTRRALETSLIPAVVAFANLGLYFGFKNTAYYLLTQFSMCGIYTLAVLVTLLAPCELDGEGNMYSCSSSVFLRPRARGHNYTMNKVEVKMTTIVERDHPSISQSEPKPRQSLTMAQMDTKLAWSSSI